MLNVSIYINNGRAYMPTLTKTDFGLYIETEPLQIVDLTLDNLQDAIRRSLKVGNPLIRQPSRDEMNKLPEVVLKAMKVRSWRKLAQEARLYSIYQDSDSYTLEFYEVGKKGVGFDPNTSRRKRFSLDTNLREIVIVLLSDIQKYPELLS